MIEFEKLEQGEELERLERLERLDEVALEKSKPEKGGVKMLKQRRKRNIEGMLERLKRLQRAVKESQKMYFVELGKAVLIWYQEYKQGRADVVDLEERLKETAELFGKNLNEPIE